jgi:hypothetical protein
MESTPITKEFIKAMRQADTVLINIYPDPDRTRYGTRNVPGKVEFTAIQEEKTNAKGWKKPEDRKEFNSVKGNFSTYDYDRLHFEPKRYFGYFPSGPKSGALQALLAILKPGDTLKINAETDNDSEFFREMDLHQTDCCADITRNGKKIIRRLVLESRISKGREHFSN